MRNQLCDTKSRLSEVANENDRLRTLFNNQDVSYFSVHSPNMKVQINHLRRCLHAAEENVIRQQNEMDILRKQLDSPTIAPSGSVAQMRLINPQVLDHLWVSRGYWIYHEFSPLEISQRLVALLKVQVGALSKVLHSSSHSVTSFICLRQYVDSLIRTVASLDENSPQRIDLLQDAFNDVIAAFENVGFKS